MNSLAKQETQPKPRLIVRLGVFLASHHILFRFTNLSPFCSLNPSFCPFSFPQLIIHHFGSVLYAALQALSQYSSFLHLQKTHTSRRMLLYLVFTPPLYFVYCYSIDACTLLLLNGVPVWWPYTQIFRLHTVDVL